MKRGDLYRVYKPAHDEKEFRVFAVVSRQALIDSRFPTLVCARVYTRAEGLSPKFLWVSRKVSKIRVGSYVMTSRACTNLG